MDSSVFENAYSRLNSAQKEAVDTIYGPVMVIAGPGTGKTQIVACRTANILSKTDARPDNILITTFTEAGVISIKKRLLEFLGPDAYKVQVATIHAFSNEVIRMYPEKFLHFRAKRPIDDIEQIALFEELIRSRKFEALSSDHDEFFYLSDIRDRIGKLKQEGVTPEGFDRLIDDQERVYADELSEIKPTLKKYETEKARMERHTAKLRELSLVYRDYLEACYERGLYDFSDMISFMASTLKADNDLAYSLSEQYQFIMLDEFQDMSSAQNQIIDSILSVSEHPNVMAVGDDDQSIYRFQGANLENMFHFSKRYEGTKFVVLTDNYRSTQPILDLARTSIEYNEWRISRFIPSIEKKLQAHRSSEGAELSLIAYTSPLEEKAATLTRVRTLVSEGVPASEIAVLVRTNREVFEFCSFLSGNGLKVQSKTEWNALESYFVRLLIDLLEVVSSPMVSEEKTLRVLRSGLFDISPVSILRLSRDLYKMNYSRKDKMKILDVLYSREILEMLGVSDTDTERFLEIGTLLADLAPKDARFYEDFKRVVEEVGFLSFVEKVGDFGDLEDSFALFELARSWSEKSQKLTVTEFLKKLEYYPAYGLQLKSNRLKATPDGVVVLTAHQSKGLEYDSVFVPGLLEGNWGKRRTVDQLKLPKTVVGSDGSSAIDTDPQEEERRLFFVAITRAKRNLFLSFPESDGTSGKAKIASQFLSELSMTPERFLGDIDYAKIIAGSIRPEIHLHASMDDEELAYIAEFLQNYRLSPSDFVKFLEDPKMFLRDAIFRYPFEDNEYTIFGKAYHRALELFYLSWKSEGSQPTKESLITNFTRNLRGEILSPELFEKLLKKGSEGLSGWYDTSASTSALPLHLEYSFSPRGIVFDGIPLTGKIDKIELLDSDTKSVRIIDYKTGRVKSLNEIKGLTANSDGKYFRQLLFYTLLFSMDSKLSDYRVEGLGIDFVEGKDGEYRLVEVDWTEEDMERTKNEIRSAWKCITDLEYWKGIMGK